METEVVRLFVRQLQAWLDKWDETHEGLSERSGIPASTISGWLSPSGGHLPIPEHFDALCKGTGMPHAYFLDTEFREYKQPAPRKPTLKEAVAVIVEKQNWEKLEIRKRVKPHKKKRNTPKDV